MIKAIGIGIILIMAVFIVIWSIELRRIPKGVLEWIILLIAAAILIKAIL